MSKTTRLARPKPKRYVSRYNEGGIVPKEASKEASKEATTQTAKVDVISATVTSQNRPKQVKKVAATGDKFNTYKTRIT